MNKKVLFLALVSLFGAATASSAHGQQRNDKSKLDGCKSADPAGYFKGSATNSKQESFEITLNLHCVGGRYHGGLETPLGAFPVTGGYFAAGRLYLQFDAGGTLGTIEAEASGDSVRGTFVVAEDRGHLELHREEESKSPPSVTGALSGKQWHEDLQFLANELATKHMNAFHHVSREQFQSAVAALDAELDHMDADAIYVGMDRIANLVGDGHTYVEFPDNIARMPLIVGQFDSEYRVIAVAPGLENALGARVVKIQGVPMARVRELIFPITPQDENLEFAEGRIANYLTFGLVLHGVGITPDRDTARFTLAPDGKPEMEITVHSLPAGATDFANWLRPFKTLPLSRQNPEAGFWQIYIPEFRTVFCNFRGYKDLGTHAEELLTMVKQQHPDKLVIDMRFNGGGDYTQGLKHLIHPIRELSAINRKGHLFVLIGTNTFSAAMNNAAQFREQTAAILVGRTIGEKPNSYQEPRQSKLPNSHWVVRYSTRYYKFVENGENVIRPEQEIKTSWADFSSGRDPVLEWVLQYDSKGHGGH